MNRLILSLFLNLIFYTSFSFAQVTNPQTVDIQVQAGHTIKQFTVTNNEHYVFTTDYKDVVMWDLRKRKIISRIPVGARELFAHPINPRYVCIVPNGKFPKDKDFIPVIDAITGEDMGIIEKGEVGTQKTFTNDMALILNNGVVDIYLRETDNLVGSLDATPAPLSGKIDVNHNGDILIGGLYPIIWNIANLTLSKPFDYFGYLMDISTQTGNIVLENNYTRPHRPNHEPQLWDPTTDARFESDGTISISGYNGDISYWNQDGSLQRVVEAKKTLPIFKYQTHEGKTIAATREGIWVGTDNRTLHSNNTINDKLGRFSYVYDVTLPLMNGKFFVACDNCKVIVGDINNTSYYSLFRETSFSVKSAQISPDKNWLLMVGPDLVREAQVDKKFYDITYDRNFSSEPRVCHYLPGNIICVGTTSGEVAFWKRGNQEQLKVEKHHKMALTDIELSPNKKHFYTSDEAGTLVIWDTATLSPIVYLHRLGITDYIFITPDNYYTGSSLLYDKVHFTNGVKIYSFEQFDLVYNRPDIIAERLGADKENVELLHSAWLRRIRRMGYTADELTKEMHAPSIRLLNAKSFPHNTTATSVTLKIKAKDTKYQLSKLMISINGVPIHSRFGIDLSAHNSREVTLDQMVELVSGKNHIEVSCINAKGAESYKEELNIWCEKMVEKPNLYLGLVGVSDYKEAAFKLGYAAKDAEDFKLMIEKYCSHRFNKIKIKILTNSEATKANINSLKEFYSNASINDVAIAFYAGHGVLDKDLNYYLATYDMDFSNPISKGWSFEEFEDMMDGIKPIAKYCFIDACHSGKIIKEEYETDNSRSVESGSVVFRGDGKTLSPTDNAKNINNVISSLFTDFSRGNGSTILSSSGGMEVAIEDKKMSNGLFTWAIKQGVMNKKADTDRDGVIHISELSEYVSAKVSELSAGVQTPGMRLENKHIDFELFK